MLLFLVLVFFLHLMLALFKAHVGYLQLFNALFRWYSSFFSSCLLEQTVLFLYFRVLITLYLEDRWWWLSHCKYKSVCVGFLYTVVNRGLSGWGKTTVSRKGRDPSGLASSVVDWMCGSMLLICSRNFSFLAASMTTSVIHISLPATGRIFSWAYGLDLKVLHVEVGHIGADGRPPGCFLQLFIAPALELEVGGLQTEL